MKTLNMFGMGLVLTLASMQIVAQTNTQLPKWPMNGKEVDFINNQVNTISTSLATPQFASNGYYGAENQRLFNIIDNNLWWGDGSFENNLYNPPYIELPYAFYPEIVVAPKIKSCCNNGSYYVVYAVKQTDILVGEGNIEVDGYQIWYNVVDPNNSSLSTAQQLIDFGYYSINSANLGIAVTNFIGDTENRRLYYVFYSDDDGASEIGFFQITPSGITGPNVIATTSFKVFEACEVEVSSDFSMLAFTRSKLFTDDPTNDITIVHLNPATGYVNTSLGTNGYTYIDISPYNSTSDHYIGLEFSPDKSYIYATRQGTGLYQYNIGSNQVSFINGTGVIGSSQLEYARDGFIYGVASNGQMYTIIPANGTFAISSHNITSSGVINNTIFNSASRPVYTLPEQIDNYNYGSLFLSQTECCYQSQESQVVTTIPGVSEDGDNIVITGSNVSWTQGGNPFTPSGVSITDIYMKGNLIINAGARLNITGLTLHFKEGQEVQLNAATTSDGTGAKLYLYSGTKLTAFDNCESDAMWEGIDVTGNWQYSQTTGSAQPYLYMSNATIEYANIGVDAPTGGKVSATLSNFKDNLIDVKFNSYAGYDNTSSFDRCDFYTTGDLYNIKGVNPQYHAQIYYASGIEFLGCDFYNNYAYQNQIDAAYWGTGILSTNSYVSVTYRCTSLLYPCPAGSTTRGTFSHLKYGIKADQGDYFTLTRCDFIDCELGAWFIGIDAITATENVFDVLNLPYSSVYFGLYIESSTGYHIEQNTFQNGLVGLVVYNSGGDDNLIYRNTFNDLTGPGFCGYGANYDYQQKSGLQLLCNNFNNVNYAMTVLGGSLYTSSGTITVSQSDIRTQQGKLVNSATVVSTMNYFTNMAAADVYFYIDAAYSPYLQSNNKYNYNHHNTSGYYLASGYYNPYNVKTFEKSTYACPSTLSSGGGIQLGMQAINDLNENEENAMTELNEILSYNEALLLANAETANSFASSSVFNSLAEQSPNLTAKIILAYVNNPKVSELSKVSLLLSNSPLPTAVIEALETTGISPEYINFVLQHQHGENPVEKLQNHLSAIKSAKQTKYDQLVRETFAADTTPEFADTYNMVIGFMANQKNVVAMKRLVKLYVHKAQYAYALDVISDINETALTDNDTNLENYCRIASIQIEMQQQCSSEPMLDIVKPHEIELLEMAANYNTKEGGIARAILESVGLMTNEPIVFLPQTDNAKSARVTQPQRSQAPSSTSLKSLFRIYPNPANDQLAIEFVNPQEGNCTFNVYSLKGELLQTVNSSQQLGFITIPVSQLAPGTYIIECPQLKSKTNFVISR